MAEQRGRQWAGIGAAAALIATALTSCREKEPQIEVVSLEGTVEAVEVHSDGTGTIKVSYFNEKAGQIVVGEGLANAETEVMINGAAGTLADIKVGDRVRGDVRVEKKAGERTLTALKIIVERARPVEPAGGG
jgi:hypothetical protein